MMLCRNGRARHENEKFVSTDTSNFESQYVVQSMRGGLSGAMEKEGKILFPTYNHNAVCLTRLKNTLKGVLVLVGLAAAAGGAAALLGYSLPVAIVALAIASKLGIISTGAIYGIFSGLGILAYRSGLEKAVKVDPYVQPRIEADQAVAGAADANAGGQNGAV